MVKTSIIDFSENISPDVNAVFSLNPSQYSRKEITRKLDYNAKDLAIPEQVHSTVVEFARFPGRHPAADGLVTTNSNILLTLKVADCVPVYLYEPRKNMIGLVHSGWRGTKGGIVFNAVRKMQEMGANGKEVSIFLGPAIGFCCYEVDEEVADNFNKKAKKKLENGKWKVGLHEEICLQLTGMGIPSTNIKTSDICTYESLDCHSYRRDGSKAGRMFAFMGLRS